MFRKSVFTCKKSSIKFFILNFIIVLINVQVKFLKKFVNEFYENNKITSRNVDKKHY